ncbi:hypothetical protein [Brachybacterium kimchii]|uniref:Uncharacterized protein n=1 Tax=Brachybacterium kimchii TaxID=2942909 RepID=A0ABY4N7E1_9MICO|nr:hypothetical protein [Brachybacterium kimchii]UQN30478.1 hypothetical protein M4486_03810 [Brachybacterium kimchii]
MSDENEKEREVYLYNLTSMTGKEAQAERRSVHLTIDMKRGTLVSLIASVIISIPVFAAALAIFQVIPYIPTYLGVLPGALAFFVALGLMLLRQRRGLQLSHGRAFIDKKLAKGRSQLGVFIQGGISSQAGGLLIIDPLESTPIRVTPSSVDNDRTQEWDTELILDEVYA